MPLGKDILDGGTLKGGDPILPGEITMATYEETAPTIAALVTKQEFRLAVLTRADVEEKPEPKAPTEPTKEQTILVLVSLKSLEKDELGFVGISQIADVSVAFVEKIYQEMRAAMPVVAQEVTPEDFPEEVPVEPIP